MPRNTKKTHALDDAVYAKWPGSSLYYKGIIVGEHDVEQDAYDLKFDGDQDVYFIGAKDIQSEAVFTARLSRAKSKSKSPSRRRRSKSPSRKKSDSPQRKRPTSPGRGRKGPRESRSEKQDSLEDEDIASVKLTPTSSEKEVLIVTNDETARVEETIVEEIKSSEVSSTVEVVEETNVTEETKVVEETQFIEETKVTRRVTRSQIKEQEQTASVQDSVETTDTTDKKSEKVQCSLRSSVACAAKFVYRQLADSVLLTLTVALMVTPLIYVYGLHFICKTSKHCTLLSLPKFPVKLSTYFNVGNIRAVFAWYSFQAFLTLLPVGQIIEGPVMSDGTRIKLRKNGVHQLTVNLLIFAALVYKNKLPLAILKSQTSLIMATALFTLFITTLAFIENLIRNGRSENGAVSDFVKGWSLNPILFNRLNLKMFGFRAGMISWMVLSLLFLAKNAQAAKGGAGVNPSLLLLSAFHFLYVTDHIVFEESVMYTMQFSTIKIGFMIMSGFLSVCPFLVSMVCRFLTMYPVVFESASCYIIPVIMNGMGYYIYRKSSLEKMVFKKDIDRNGFPTDLQYGVDYLTTGVKKYVLMKGWWGRLRNPNYTGDMLMATAWAGVCGFSHFYPWIYPTMLVLQLVAMACDGDSRLKNKYNEAWAEYQKRVPYRMIPYVF